MLDSMLRVTIFTALVLLAGCNHSIYLRDGVTDGDTFHLAPRALVDDDPVLQSWVSYSLMRSTCQLQIDAANPARASSYGCEFSARQNLLDTWEEQKLEHAGVADPYLDSLLEVRNAGFLDEYTVIYFSRKHWQVPVEVDTRTFVKWRRTHLPQHKPETRWIGFWSYGDSARP